MEIYFPSEGCLNFFQVVTIQFKHSNSYVKCFNISRNCDSEYKICMYLGIISIFVILHFPKDECYS